MVLSRQRISENIEVFEFYLRSLVPIPRGGQISCRIYYLYAKKWPSSHVLEVLEQTVGEDKGLILKCIRQGIDDGSLRPDLNPDLTMAAIHNLNSSLLGRLEQMGGKLQEEFGIGADVIFSEIYRLFINGIKVNSVSGKRKSKALADNGPSRKAHLRKFKK